MRFTRWSFYLLLSMIAVVFAESLSWSTPIIVANIMTLVFYGLHYILYIDFLAQKNALTLRALAVGGLVLGITTESILTKVIWNPPRVAGDETIKLLGLGVFEVGFIVGIWHVWVSSALPIGLTMSYFGPSNILTKAQMRRLLKWLPLAVFFSASVAGYDPLTLLVAIAVNIFSILLTIAWFRRQHAKHPLSQISQLILTRWERRIIWLAILGLYAVGWVAFRPEAYPETRPFLLGMILVVGSLWMLWRMRLVDTNQALPREDFQFTYRGFVKYTLYFALVSLVLGTIAFFSVPISTVIAIISAFLTVPIGNKYLLRLAWRLVRRKHGLTKAVYTTETLQHRLHVVDQVR